MPSVLSEPRCPRSKKLLVRQIKYLISPRLSQLETLRLKDQRIHIKSGHKLRHKTPHIFHSFVQLCLQYGDFPRFCSQRHYRHFQNYVPDIETLLWVNIRDYFFEWKHHDVLINVIQGDSLARGPKQIWEKYSSIWRKAFECAWM